MHGDFTNFEDLHAIAGALKLYFRELPIPLITFDNYDLALIAASELKNRFLNPVICIKVVYFNNCKMRWQWCIFM